MKHKLSLRREALGDMADAESYYDEEQPGVAERFRNEVAKTLPRIEENPKLFPVSGVPGYRTALLDDFPFSIIYSIEKNAKLIVIAVHDARRNPNRWQQRTKP